MIIRRKQYLAGLTCHVAIAVAGLWPAVASAHESRGAASFPQQSAAPAVTQGSGPATGLASTDPVASQVSEIGDKGDDTLAKESSDIVVVGTRVRGVAPVGASVQVLGAQDIQQSGRANVQQILQEVPSVSALGLGEGSRGSQGGNDNFGGTSSINLRGLGPQATLTLIDSHRVPSSQRTRSSVDPTLLPIEALSRVEVLPNGASAVYGSDAVAGVVNFVLRRDLNGVEGTARGAFANDYTEGYASLALGKVWSGGQAMVTLSHNEHTSLPGLSRAYNTADLRPFGGSDFRSTRCYPGNININGTAYAVPNGPPTPGSLVAGTVNRCDPYAGSDLLPSVKRDTAVGTFSQALTSWLNFRADGYISRRKSDGVYAYDPVNVTIPQDSAFFVLPAGVTLAQLPNCASPALAGLKCYSVDTNLGGALGVKHYTERDNYYMAHGQLDAQLGGGWTASLQSAWGLTDIDLRQDNYSSGALTAATQGANRLSAATAFDPFSNRTSSATAATLRNFFFEGFGKNYLTNVEGTVQGALFDAPGGPVRVSVGGEYRKELSKNMSYQGVAGSPPNSNFRLDRTVVAQYGEVIVPLFGPDNDIPVVNSLRLSAAVRHEHYNDFGDTTNPRFGVDYAPVSGFTLRGSYGTSFRAPTSNDLNGTNAAAVVYFPVLDPLTGGINFVAETTGGNPSLQPETAKNYALGFDFKPVVLRGFSLSATWYRIAYRNKIDSIFLNPNVLVNAAQFPNLVTRTRDAAAYAALERQYLLIGPSQAGAAVAIVNGLNQNLGAVQTTGIDATASYEWRIGTNVFRALANATRINSYLVRNTPGGAQVDQINQYGYPVRWQGRGGLSWLNGPIDASLFMNYTGSYNYAGGAPVTRVHDYKTVDLHIGLTPGGIDRRLNVSFDFNNLFDEDPPFVNIAPSQYNPGGFDPQVASAIGRVMAVRVSFKY